MLVTLALTVVGAVVGSLLARRKVVSRQQIFAAVAATVAAVLIMGRPGGNDTAWYYVSLAISVSMVTFLILLWLRPRRMPPQVGSSRTT
jgi:Na+/melibiose symporter-like transporter